MPTAGQPQVPGRGVWRVSRRPTYRRIAAKLGGGGGGGGGGGHGANTDPPLVRAGVGRRSGLFCIEALILYSESNGRSAGISAGPRCPVRFSPHRQERREEARAAGAAQSWANQARGRSAGRLSWLNPAIVGVSHEWRASAAERRPGQQNRTRSDLARQSPEADAVSWSLMWLFRAPCHHLAVSGQR